MSVGGCLCALWAHGWVKTEAQTFGGEGSCAFKDTAIFIFPVFLACNSTNIVIGIYNS